VRIAVGVEYDGTAFCGWQAQKDAVGVQQSVETAFSAVADEPISAVCAGRTDAGVHALGQVIHFETDARRTERNWILGANSGLPDSVRVHWTRQVPDDFHARFSATGRRYCYLILNTKTSSALLRDRTCWQHRPLDVAAMQAGAKHLIGEHDFSAFRAAACQAHSPVRQVETLTVERLGDQVRIGISANAFLHHMVRNIAGALMRVGSAEAEPEWVSELLRSCDRTEGAATAPPQGLYFMSVRYPDRFSIPASGAPTGSAP
jgi:tRNA pseudouridine38-40 synthase